MKTTAYILLCVCLVFGFVGCGALLALSQSLTATTPVQVIPAAPQSGVSVKLGWTVTNWNDVAGFNVKFGTNAAHLNASFPVGRLTAATVPGLAEWTWWHFAVVAVGSNGVESLPSNTTKYFVTNVYVGPKLSIDQIPVFTVKGFAPPRSTNIFQWGASVAGPWENLQTNIVTGTNPALVSVTVTNTGGAKVFRALIRR